MRTNRVEIPQQNTLGPAAFSKFIDDLFSHLLGVAVRGLGRFGRSQFGHRDHVRVAIDGAGGGKHEIGDVEFLYAFQQVDQRHEVVLEIHQRVFDGLSYCLVCGEVDDARDVLVLLEDGERVVVVAQIDLVVLDLFSGDLFYSFEDPGGAADVVVDAYDLDG